MVYRIRRTVESQEDLDLAFDHFVSSYLGYGDTIEEAFERASRRLRKVSDEIEGLALFPHKGTRNPEMEPHLRHMTRDGMVIYFNVNDAARMVTVLAIFFGPQDHQRHMIGRLLKRKSTDS